MPLKIIRSGLTSKNSDIYIGEIKQYSVASTDKKLILMVPDRFSYIAEKLICEHIGGVGFGGVSVMTLHQLIRRVTASDKVLSSEGKQMLLRCIINNSIDETSVFYGAKDRNGFVETVLEVMNDWKRFCIDISELDTDINSLSEGMTKEKLSDLRDIYIKYTDAFNKNNYKDEADLLTDAAAVIKSGMDFSRSVIWIDGFVEFVPAELSIISAFLSVGADVKIYLPCKTEGMVEPDDVYYVPHRTCHQLINLCENEGYEYIVETKQCAKDMSDEIKFLCNTYDDKEQVYKGSFDGITISQADDIYTEVENAASEILNLVCNKGFKFSDISVLCGDSAAYNSCIEAVFSRYSIPYFSDYKVPLSNHPVSILLMSVFDIVNKKSFLPSPMMRYLKTGYIISDNDDVDYMSLFIQKRGIRGSMWNDDKYFELSDTGFFDAAMGKEAKRSHHSERLTKLRKDISEPLFAYYEKTKGKKTVTDHIRAFFDFLNDIDLFEKIHTRVQEFEEMGEDNEASRLAHVWNLLINLFDQMVIAVGDEKITRGVFGEYLKAGIEGSEISIIPTVTNGVSVSDAGHRKGSEVKALMILGATRDTVPVIKHEDGLITEAELENITSLPVTVSKSHRNQSKEFELLTAFSETSDLLYMSWCRLGSENEKEVYSPIFRTLMNKFPGLDFHEIDNESYVSSPEAMLHRLLVRIASGETLSPYEKAAARWFAGREEWQEALSLLEEAEKYQQLAGSIPKDISAELYKNLTEYSVSRIEKYFQCPFMYFVSYGLKLDDGEPYGMKSTDTGSLVHHALAQFCVAVEENASTPEEKLQCWKGMNEAKCDEYIGRIMDDIIASSGISTEEDPKMESVFNRLTTTVRKAADIIVLMFNKGKYTIYGNEIPFENFKITGAEGEVNFRGVIDRLDILEDDGKLNIRVVDYKTGEKKFKFEDALNGIDLQLLIYAMAAEYISGENSDVTGFFYNSIKKRIAKCDDPGAASKELAKLYKLSGVVVEKLKEKGFEVKTGSDMDCELAKTLESDFLPLKLKTSGGYWSNSGVESPEFLAEVFRNIRNIVSDGASKIENGDVRVYPYVSGTKDSCRFCPYSSVCMYDHCRGAQINSGEKGKLLAEEIRINNKAGD